MRDRLSVWRYEGVQRRLTSDGYVQQHVVRLVDRDGTAVEMPACLVVRIRDGRIVRIDEYCDSSPTRALDV
jgi:ketosteroid isomerase-like protein